MLGDEKLQAGVRDEALLYYTQADDLCPNNPQILEAIAKIKNTMSKKSQSPLNQIVNQIARAMNP